MVAYENVYFYGCMRGLLLREMVAYGAGEGEGGGLTEI